MFRPKIIDALNNYSRGQFLKDLISGVIVGIVALPLAIAFAMAYGVSPEKGIITAIIGGFVISVLGGSRVQIGGPTGAFIVVVYGIVQQFGVSGLTMATLIAGIMLIIIGFARLGSVIKFIPYPLIVGFTAGIAVIIFSSQIKDLLGLGMGPVPVDFIEKWNEYGHHLGNISPYAIGIGLGTILIVVLFPRVSHKIPGSLIAIILFTGVVSFFHFPVETIGSRFGMISSSLPAPVLPVFSWQVFKSLLRPAFTIAVLGGIESLLSAVVADGMIGGNHRSNMELVAQGVANMASSVFGGVPATGAIARTATNVKNGGRTPVAGIIHSITLLIILLLAGRWASLIPLSCLAGILVIVAFHMSEYETFFNIARGNRSDAAVLVTTFLLTVLFDLTIAIEIGMVMAAFLFMRKMIQISEISKMFITDDQEADDLLAADKYPIPKEVEVFELKGPLFFGAAYKFKDAIREIEKKPLIMILRMRQVPIIDATGLHTIEDIQRICKREGTRLIISGIQPSVKEQFKESRLFFKIGGRYFTDDFGTAVSLAKTVLREIHGN
ncbi:MAG TPA: SulP family inorganic anion transporter [Puia sp.]|jgi:SulP family sulfate permease